MIEIIKKIKQGEDYNLEFKSQFTKELAKDACAFANTKNGGEVIIGISDEGEILGIKLSKKQYTQKIADILQGISPLPSYEIKESSIDSYKILSLVIKEGTSLAAYRNVVYVRNGANNYPLSVHEILEKSAENMTIVFDRLKSKVSIKDFSKTKFKKYLQTRQKIRGVEFSQELVNTAQALGFVKDSYLTNAGILCFTRYPQEFISNSIVRIVVFNDDSMTQYSDSREFSGDLLNISQEVEDFLSKLFKRTGGFRLGFTRQDFLEYPMEGIREAIVNALIHRNYFDQADVRIFLFPDRLEIINPGDFPPGVSEKKPEHKPRNPLLSQFFYDLGWIEKYGSGINKIKESVREHPLVEVEFHHRPYCTKVIFKKKRSSLEVDKINQKILDSISTGQSSSQIARLVGISKQAVVTRLNDLISLNLIYKKGKGRNTLYALNRGK